MMRIFLMFLKNPGLSEFIANLNDGEKLIYQKYSSKGIELSGGRDKNSTCPGVI